MWIKGRVQWAAAALSGSLCLWAINGNTADPAADMRARIAALEKEQAAIRALPIEQKWALQEEQLTHYEDKVYEGDAQANLFLVIGRKNLAESRRRRFIEQWGDALLGRAEARAELTLHGKRMAELKRVRMLARARKFPALIGQAEELLGAERARHEARMQALKANLGGVAIGGGQ